MSLSYPFVGDSRRQVGLTAAAGTAQNQPADGLSGEFPGRLTDSLKLGLVDGIAALPQRLQILEGEAGQRAQVAVRNQTGTPFVNEFPPGAGAAHDTTVVLLTGGQQRVDDTRSLTDSAVRTGRRGYIIVGPCVRIFP